MDHQDVVELECGQVPQWAKNNTIPWTMLPRFLLALSLSSSLIVQFSGLLSSSNAYWQRFVLKSTKCDHLLHGNQVEPADTHFFLP
mmetsp:Transcript_21418/g.27372  ORF Transcript_21418/g.27372 Transcript_21418/m.27372 type:complete len:86 (-) Transcript_21418:791-1048(-)